VNSYLKPGRLGWQTRSCVIVLVAVHVSLLAWSSTRHSPTNGEVPALAAGVWHWQEGRFDVAVHGYPLSPREVNDE